METTPLKGAWRLVSQIRCRGSAWASALPPLNLADGLRAKRGDPEIQPICSATGVKTGVKKPWPLFGDPGETKRAVS
jgi:hypothetical protein